MAIFNVDQDVGGTDISMKNFSLFVCVSVS